jgi:hypothetical protein
LEDFGRFHLYACPPHDPAQRPGAGLVASGIGRRRPSSGALAPPSGDQLAVAALRDGGPERGRGRLQRRSFRERRGSGLGPSCRGPQGDLLHERRQLREVAERCRLLPRGCQGREQRVAGRTLAGHPAPRGPQADHASSSRYVPGARI